MSEQPPSPAPSLFSTLHLQAPAQRTHGAHAPRGHLSLLPAPISQGRGSCAPYGAGLLYAALPGLPAPRPVRQPVASNVRPGARYTGSAPCIWRIAHGVPHTEACGIVDACVFTAGTRVFAVPTPVSTVCPPGDSTPQPRRTAFPTDSQLPNGTQKISKGQLATHFPAGSYELARNCRRLRRTARSPARAWPLETAWRWRSGIRGCSARRVTSMSACRIRCPLP